MCRSGAVDLICIDSVSALTPRAEIEVTIYLFVFLLPLFLIESYANNHFDMINKCKVVLLIP